MKIETLAAEITVFVGESNQLLITITELCCFQTTENEVNIIK